MSELDEIEKGALSMVDYFDHSGEVVCNVNAAVLLARAVLAMLPVVRAAEAFRVVHDADELVSNREVQQRCDGSLCDAIGTMRRALEER